MSFLGLPWRALNTHPLAKDLGTGDSAHLTIEYRVVMAGYEGLITLLGW